MSNSFTFTELHSKDPAQSKAFFGALFDWKFTDLPGNDYTMIPVGEGSGGGIMKTLDPKAPAQWVPYVTVAKVDETVKKAKTLGAKVVMEPLNMDAYKIRICILMDPMGVPCGLLQNL